MRIRASMGLLLVGAVLSAAATPHATITDERLGAGGSGSGGAGGGGTTSVTSPLWGQSGELWQPGSRLPVVAWAGFHDGEAPPDPGANIFPVTDYGATPDDDQDDTDAIEQAIEAAQLGLLPSPSGAISGVQGAVDSGVLGASDYSVVTFPAGRYLVSKQLHITGSAIVLQGAGPDRTILEFLPQALDAPDALGRDDRERELVLLGGRVEQPWVVGDDWSGDANGFEPTDGPSTVRGGFLVHVTGGANYAIGSRLRLRQMVDVGATPRLAAQIAGGPQGGPGLGDDFRYSLTQEFLVAEIIDDQTIRADRPLRWATTKEPVDGRAAYVERPRTGSVELGVEDLTLLLPDLPSPGHLEETGQGGIEVRSDHSWVRNVHIVNADTAIQTVGAHISLLDVEVSSVREPDRSGWRGHHAIHLGGQDQLLDGFVIDPSYRHGVTVAGTQGSVVTNGRSSALDLDHHRKLPYANVFTDLDAGDATDLWRSGGSAAAGFNMGAFNTYWNIRSDAGRPAAWPIDVGTTRWGHFMVNVVAVSGLTAMPSSDDGPLSRWYRPGNLHLEGVSPQRIRPSNLWQAQRAARDAGRFDG